MNGLLHGNLGYSYAENQTVAQLFGERLARSIYLSGISLLLAIVIALPLGVFQAVWRNLTRRQPGHQPGLHSVLDAVVLPGLILLQVFALSFPILGFEAASPPPCGR